MTTQTETSLRVKKAFCFKVTCDCTNSSHNTVARADGAEPKYLDCNDRELFVMADTLSEVEAIVGPNARVIGRLGLCYAKKEVKP
jgi:hypothetical protein